MIAISPPLLLGEFGAAALLVELDRFAALLDHALHHLLDLGIGDAVGLPLGRTSMSRSLSRARISRTVETVSAVLVPHRLLQGVGEALAQHRILRRSAVVATRAAFDRRRIPRRSAGLTTMPAAGYVQALTRPLPCRAARCSPCGAFWRGWRATELEDPLNRMTDAPTPPARPAGTTAALVLADGSVFWGRGFGAAGIARRRGLLQHQHDRLSGDPDRSLLCRADHHLHLPAYRQCRRQPRGHRDRRRRRRAAWWCASTSPSRRTGARRSISMPGSSRNGLVGLAGVDTRRADPPHPRRRRAQRRARATRPTAGSTSRRSQAEAARLAGARGHGPRQGGLLPPDLCAGTRRAWRWGQGYGRLSAPRFHVVAVDYGAKRNILRMPRRRTAARVTVVPATATAEDILRHEPDGIFLSNGPGDPAATGDYAVPVIRELLATRQAALRHLPRPSAAGAGARRARPTRWRSAIAAPIIR